MKKLFTIIIFSILLSLNFYGKIRAQETTAVDRKLAVSGVADEAGNLSVNLSGDPGESITGSTVVTNLGSELLKIRSEFQDFIVEEETGAPILVKPESTIWAMSLWMSVPKDMMEFTLEPNESKEITFAINIPENAAPGGHYAMVLFTPVIVKESVAGPLVEHKVGNIVKLTVSGDIRESAEITEFSAPYFSEYGPINLKLKILNNGNTHITSSGTIIIKNMLGKEVAKWELKPANIFPSSVRTFNTEWPGKWRFGIYSAGAIVKYGTKDAQISATINFLIIPWKILAGIIVAITVLIAWGKYKNRKNKEKIEKINSTNLQNEKDITSI